MRLGAIHKFVHVGRHRLAREINILGLASYKLESSSEHPLSLIRLDTIEPYALEPSNPLVCPVFLFLNRCKQQFSATKKCRAVLRSD